MDDENPGFTRSNRPLQKLFQSLPGVGDIKPVEVDVRLDGVISAMQTSGHIWMDMIHRPFDVFRCVSNLKAQSIFNQILEF